MQTVQMRLGLILAMAAFVAVASTGCAGSSPHGNADLARGVDGASDSMGDPSDAATDGAQQADGGAVRFGIYQAYGKDSGQQLGDVFEGLAELGIKQASFFSTLDLQAAQTNGDRFDDFDRVYAAATAAGVELLPWIRARPDHDCTKVSVAEMDRFLPKVIERYPKLRTFKILKEHNMPCNKELPQLGNDLGIDESQAMAIASKARQVLDAATITMDDSPIFLQQ